MSHELRTPLNAMLGFTQLLQDSKNLGNQDKSDLQTIEQSGNHLLNLIDDILDIAKIEAGKIEIQLDDVFFPKFLQDLVEITQVLASKKNISFGYHFSDDLPQFVHADAQRLRQILLNLLSNAIKFTEKGNVILRVSCLKLLDLNSDVSKALMPINFEVEDSGLGIDINRQESIFLPFEQAGDTRFKAQGTGLGLAISQKIAGMMGSKITVVSQKDVGSIFRFTVDLGSPTTQFLSSSDKFESNDTSAFDPDLSQKLPLKILLAEDNAVNQKIVRKILNKLGYEIDIASNGLKVLAAVREHNYDVILMDVQMPEMDGIEATKYIVNDKDLKHRPYIIALTANAMDSDRLMCLDAGMNDFMKKPINVNLLVEALWRSRCGYQIA
jgi:CheY-like chemotaxis protein